MPIPKGKDWDNFFKVSENKDGLFLFSLMSLLKKTQESPRILVTMKKDDVLSNKCLDVSSIKKTGQDEAATRIILHLSHAVENGHMIAYNKDRRFRCCCYLSSYFSQT